MEDLTQEQIMYEDGYVPALAAAGAAGVHVTTILRLIDSGKVRGQRAGASRYVHKAGLIAYYSSATSIAKRIRDL